MSDRYEVARDFLLERFKPEELPGLFHDIFRRLARPESRWPWHRTFDRAFEDRCRLVFTRYAPRLGVDPFSFQQGIFRDAVRAFLSSSETPPRTSPPSETESTRECVTCGYAPCLCDQQ